MNAIHKSCLVVAAALLALPCAESLAAAGHPMRFDRITMSDGLSQNTVSVVVQDKTGFLWLGTESGLNRYDGYQFYHYKRDPGNPQALSDDFIRGLSEDANGDIWIATNGGGLVRWNSGSDTFTTFGHEPGNPQTVASDKVSVVLADANGWVWAGTRGRGLNRIDPSSGEVQHFMHDPDVPNSLAGNAVNALLSDSRGAIWVATDNGLSRFDPITATFATFRHDPEDDRSLSNNRVRALLEDRNGAIWVGTQRAGLNRLDRNATGFVRFMHDPEDAWSIGNNWIRALLEDDAGRIWVGTHEGLHLYDRDRQGFYRYVHDRADPGSLAEDVVVSLFQDRAGVLWVGTRSSGISKWNPRSWAFGHFSAERLSNGNVTSFAEDADRVLWVGTFGGGLNQIDRASGEVTVFRHSDDDPASISDDHIMSLLLDSQRNLWMGTMFGGLNRRDAETGEITYFKHDPASPATISEKGIMSLFEDSGGNIWVGTFGGGVNFIEKDSTAVLRLPYQAANGEGLSAKRATAFAEDRHGRMWIGTDGGGLNVYDPQTGQMTVFRNDVTDPTSISADTVYSLHVDLNGTIWVGTQGGGLNRVIGDTRSLSSLRFESLTKGENQVANDVVYGIESDTRGELWLSTNYGITHYSPQTGQIRNFHRSHGLQDEEFHFGSHYRSQAGELFFGGANGFNAFFPSDLEINANAPQVILSRVSLLNQPVAGVAPHWQLEGLDLGYRDSVISFEFSALDFTAPGENKYAYMLEGFDPGWIDAGTLHHVTYTNLDSGSYVFRVRGANSDGVWQEDGVSLPFYVAAAPWQTWWAYVIYAAFGCLLLALALRAQQKRKERENEYLRRLEQDVQARTKELAERNDDLKHLNQRFLEASLTDPLTGLRNRRYVFEEVAKDIDIVRRRYRDADGDDHGPDQSDVVFMMIDLDNFKPVNDTCGHAAGDEMLLQIRDILLETCRESDVVIRWGGDEFLVIGRYADQHQSEALAERIRERMANAVFTVNAGQATRTTVSIGMASFPFARTHPELLDWEQILGLADAAMYQAKTRRNAWVAVVGTEKSGDVINPFYSFRDHQQTMIEQGMLEVHRSFDPAADDDQHDSSLRSA